MSEYLIHLPSRFEYSKEDNQALGICLALKAKKPYSLIKRFSNLEALIENIQSEKGAFHFIVCIGNQGLCYIDLLKNSLHRKRNILTICFLEQFTDRFYHTENLPDILAFPFSVNIPETFTVESGERLIFTKDAPKRHQKEYNFSAKLIADFAFTKRFSNP